MKTTKPLAQKQSAPPETSPAVTVYELTDPSTASENFEVLDQDIVHLGSTSFSAIRVVIQLDKSVLIFAPDELMQHLRRRGREETFQTPRGTEIWHSRQTELRRLFDLGKRLAETATSEPAILNDNIDIRAAAHTELLECLLSTFQVIKHSEPTRLEQTSQRYSQIVKTAEEFVMEQQGLGYSVTEMCEATATSERTLQYAFRKTLDMTPVEYLIRLRLHRARHDLLKANAKSTTVSRIAVNWGFWHFGEFSTAYKSCFEEMPSETLRRKLE